MVGFGLMSRRVISEYVEDIRALERRIDLCERMLHDKGSYFDEIQRLKWQSYLNEARTKKSGRENLLRDDFHRRADREVRSKLKNWSSAYAESPLKLSIDFDFASEWPVLITFSFENVDSSDQKNGRLEFDDRAEIMYFAFDSPSFDPIIDKSPYAVV